MALEAAVQRRARQAGNSRLERIQAIIQRQKWFAKGHTGGLLLRGQHRGAGLLRAHRRTMHEAPFLPLGDSFGIDSVALRERV